MKVDIHYNYLEQHFKKYQTEKGQSMMVYIDTS